MKVLAIGDIHGDIGLARKLVKRGIDENVELFLFCGDIVHSKGKINGVVHEFVKTGKKVGFVPGNHDRLSDVGLFEEFYKMHNLEKYSFKLGDLGFFGDGGVNIGFDARSEGEIFNNLAKGFKYLDEVKKKIMVTHVPPSGLKMEMMSRFVSGSQGVRMAVDRFKPDLVLCSHIHEADGLEEEIGGSRIVNVGRKGFIFDA